MQVANTLNNSIRILFNPKIEAFKLFDLLIVKSDDKRYIAQIIEIYDDKFDASQNVAKLKLFYRMTDTNEVLPYDNFTPNKECEIIKIKQDEVETFINQDKETFIFGTNTKSSTALNIQYDFFNNAIVLADKVENACAISYNLAKNLSKKQNVVIIDSTGAMEYENAKIIKAGKNFRMPLNYNTIDYIFDKCLSDASLEFQSVCGEIINEIKRFAKKQESEFIPFNTFAKVILEQYKATPYPELKLLLVRLKKYQMDEIFAKNKNDKENLEKAITKNPITIIDLSEIDSRWQKAYMEYIISAIEEDIYLITRINDEYFDVNLINTIYDKKTNIKFVPNVSYVYKKLPSVMQHCENYILMPSLYQRTDFLDANFALSNLISDGCIIYGQNTDGFLYLAQDYELDVQEKRKNYRKIALTMIQQDEENEKNELSEEKDDFSNSQMISDSERLMKELSNYKTKIDDSIENAVPEEVKEEKIKQEIEEQKEQIEKTEEKVEDNTFSENNEEDIQPEKVEEKVEEKLEQDDELGGEKKHSYRITTPETSIQEESKEENEIVEQEPQIQEQQEKNNVLIEEPKLEEIDETTLEEDNSLEEIENPTILVNDEDEIVEKEVDLSDEELDFFQIAQQSADEYDEDEEKVEAKEKKAESEEEHTEDKLNIEDVEEISTEDEDDIDLSEVADNSINDNFEEIINTTTNQENMPTIDVTDDKSINSEILEKNNKEENLPIFKDEEEKKATKLANYSVGDIITHGKYGRGTVVKTIKYEDRQLLQVEFELTGKKLLDPTVANVKLEQ